MRLITPTLSSLYQKSPVPCFWTSFSCLFCKLVNSNRSANFFDRHWLFSRLYNCLPNTVIHFTGNSVRIYNSFHHTNSCRLQKSVVVDVLASGVEYGLEGLVEEEQCGRLRVLDALAHWHWQPDGWYSQLGCYTLRRKETSLQIRLYPIELERFVHLPYPISRMDSYIVSCDTLSCTDSKL